MTGPRTPAPRPDPTSTPLAGRYVLVDQIGLGGMGSVWRAWDIKHQRFVAAKVLGQHDGSMLLRFVREQSVRIQHPHVVAPSGWAAEDNLVVFAMDLVHGGSIHTLLGDHGALPSTYVAVVLDQILQALQAVHGAGVVHRDIKPANLLLEATGTGRPHVRVGDFGVAALVDEVRLTRFPGAIGTDGYMAPEQLDGAAPDPRQDLYAAGVVAIQMLTGLGPRDQHGAPPGPLQDLLNSMTSTDVDHRPPTASAALDYLRRCGVPPGAPWQQEPEPPEVFDQLGQVAVPNTSAYVAGHSGTPSGGAAQGSFPPRDRAPSGTPSHPGPLGPLSGPQAGPLDAAGPTTNPAMTATAVACFLISIGLCVAALILLFG